MPCLMFGDKKYTGGGVNVIANPEGTPTDELNTVQIDDTVYELVGSGGGGGSFEVIDLWENETGETTGEKTLSDSIDNYDFISVWCGLYREYTDSPYVMSQSIISVGELNSLYASGIHYTFSGYDNRSTYIDFYGNKANVTLTYQNQVLLKVVGIKYGSSGGGSGLNNELIPITDPTNTTSRTFELPNTPMKVSISYNTSDNWYFHWEFTWGDGWASWLAKSTTSISGGATTGLSKIEYGQDNKSFTITGNNASQAANSSGGNGLLYLDYGKAGNVSDSSKAYLFWNFKQSSLDMNQFSPAYFQSAEISSDGAMFTNTNGYIRFSDYLLRKNMTYEIKIKSMSITDTTRHNDLFRFQNLSSTQNAGLIYRYQSLKWAVWDSVNGWQESSITDKDYFNDCTLTIKILSDGKWEIYKDDVLVFSPPAALPFEGTASWGIGSPESGYSINGMVIESVKIYHNN